MSGNTPRKPRRLRKVQVGFVSLVERGANLQPSLYKAEEGALEIRALAKSDDEGLLHALVYVPNKVDAHGDWMAPEDVRFAAHAHMRAGATLDLHHDLQALSKDQAYVVESFVLQGPDPRFPTHDRTGAVVDHAGAWGMVIQLEDPALRELAKAGKLSEVSLYAAGGKYESTSEAPITKAEDSDIMDETKLKAAMQEALAPVLTGLQDLVKALTPKTEDKSAAKTDDPPKPTGPVSKSEDGTPIFKGDPSNALHLREYRRALEDHELAKSFEGEMGTAEGVSKFEEMRRKLDAQRADEDAKTGITSGGSLGIRKRLENTSTPAAGVSGVPSKYAPSDLEAHNAAVKAADDLTKALPKRALPQSV